MPAIISLRGRPRRLFHERSFEAIRPVWARIEGMSPVE
ncbi:hypothetical protein AGTUEHA105_LOCUS1893 [Agrobacterium tumefaciens]|jgi:hypothetical protein|nr:hypothetical protein AGTUEHA105_LOCUS1893 [Agrobacterium tumefaciens]